jgi:hypothetical protein
VAARTEDVEGKDLVDIPMEKGGVLQADVQPTAKGVEGAKGVRYQGSNVLGGRILLDSEDGTPPPLD